MAGRRMPSASPGMLHAPPCSSRFSPCCSARGELHRCAAASPKKNAQRGLPCAPQRVSLRRYLLMLRPPRCVRGWGCFLAVCAAERGWEDACRQGKGCPGAPQRGEGAPRHPLPCPCSLPCPDIAGGSPRASQLAPGHQQTLGSQSPKSPFTSSKSRWGHRDPGGHPDTSLCPPKGAQRLAAASLHRTAQQGLDHNGFVGCLNPKSTPPGCWVNFGKGIKPFQGLQQECKGQGKSFS